MRDVIQDDKLRPDDDAMNTEESLTEEEKRRKEYKDRVVVTLAEMTAEVEAFGGAKYSFYLDFEGSSFVTNKAVAK